jgi:hypothetical protein
VTGGVIGEAGLVTVAPVAVAVELDSPAGLRRLRAAGLPDVVFVGGDGGAGSGVFAESSPDGGAAVAGVAGTADVAPSAAEEATGSVGVWRRRAPCSRRAAASRVCRNPAE